MRRQVLIAALRFVARWAYRSGGVAAAVYLVGSAGLKLSATAVVHKLTTPEANVIVGTLALIGVGISAVVNLRERKSGQARGDALTRIEDILAEQNRNTSEIKGRFDQFTQDVTRQFRAIHEDIAADRRERALERDRISGLEEAVANLIRHFRKDSEDAR